MKHQTSGDTGFILIGGAGLTSRIWSETVVGLNRPSLAVEYPLRDGPDNARSKLSLEDYVMSMKLQVDEWGMKRTVIVSHSLGGVPALRLAAMLTGRIAGFAAVGAVIPRGGGSFLSALPVPRRWVISAIMRLLGTKPPAAAIRAGLCSDLSEEQREEIVASFVPEAVRVYTDRAGAAIPDVPRLYVKLTEDKELVPSLQNRMIAALSPHEVQQLATGHLPMLSDPAGLCRILNAFADNVG